MKVDGNKPSFIYDQEMGSISGSNIPIRLEIASRILAGIWSTAAATEVDPNKFPTDALLSADALIKAHSETSWGE